MLIDDKPTAIFHTLLVAALRFLEYFWKWLIWGMSPSS